MSKQTTRGRVAEEGMSVSELMELRKHITEGECRNRVTVAEKQRDLFKADRDALLSKLEDCQLESDRLASDRKCLSRMLNESERERGEAKDFISYLHDVLGYLERDRNEAIALLKEVLDDWDELNGPRYHGGPGACDGPEGCRTRARAFLTRMKGVET